MQDNHDGKAEWTIRENVRYYGMMGGEALSTRIHHLEEEWDRDRLLMAIASGLGVFGLVAGLLGAKAFRIFTWMSLPMLFLHALGRWVPPAEALRRMGARPRREIDEERFALKALRGDFQGVAGPGEPESEALSKLAARALDAVKA